jgi:type I restriction enzyme S subunit
VGEEMKVRLPELCTIQYGFAFDSSEFTDDESFLPIVRIRDVKRGYSETYYRGDFSDEYILHAGDLLIGMDGEFNIARWKSRDALLNQRVCKVVARDGTDEEYLRFALSRALKDIENKTAFVTVKHLSAKELNKLELNVPDYENQNEISLTLSSIERIIELHTKQLQALNDLVKARFVEMFGDPIINSQNRPTTEFVNIVKMQRGFDLPVQDRQQEGDIPVYGSNGALDHHNVAKIRGGGVITGRSGTIGKLFYTEGAFWPLNTTLFSIDTHGNNIVYLAYLLEMFNLSRFVEGTGVPTLNRNMFHNKQIINVGIIEQNQFANFVAQVDKSKVAVQKALEQTQLLFNSLMQQYFG